MSLQILSLTLFPVRGLNDVYRRSYRTNITYENKNALDTATEGGTKITPTAIAQVAPSIIAPSAQVDALAPIVNGWGQERYRFIMKVEETNLTGIKSIIYYIGHTDYGHEAVTATGHIAPELNFFINATHNLGFQLGGGVERVVPRGANQILYGPDSIASSQHGQITTQWSMRPQEVFNAQTVFNSLASQGMVDDVGYVDGVGSLITGGRFSSRRNNSPGSFLYETLTAYNAGLHAAVESEYDDSQILTEASIRSRDKDVYRDPLFYDLQRLASKMASSGQFSWQELNQYAPYVDSITQVVDDSQLMMSKASAVDNRFGNVWHAGNTASWASSDNETIAATLIANAVPTFMIENLISDLRVTFTNQTIDGSISYQIFNANSIEKTINSHPLLQRVIDRTMVEILPQVSMHGNFTFNVLIDSSIVGETLVSIEINNGGSREYVMPTFADNMASPILTSDRNLYLNVVNDIFSISQDLLNKTVDKTSTPQFITTLNQQQAFTENNRNNGFGAPSSNFQRFNSAPPQPTSGPVPATGIPTPSKY